MIALASIITSVDRTDRMVRQLLELATVETDQAEYTPLPLADLCSELAEELAPLAANRHVTLTVQVPAGMHVLANRFLLYAALRNVTENAVLASPAEAAVSIKADAVNDVARLTISDRGPGIAPQERDRITERFYRGHNPSSGGSGLGLAIAVAAMERMAGTLAFGHEGPGLTVGLHIPLS